MTCVYPNGELTHFAAIVSGTLLFFGRLTESKKLICTTVGRREESTSYRRILTKEDVEGLRHFAREPRIQKILMTTARSPKSDGA